MLRSRVRGEVWGRSGLDAALEIWGRGNCKIGGIFNRDPIEEKD